MRRVEVSPLGGHDETGLGLVFDPWFDFLVFGPLHDERGPMGRAAQSLYVAPR